MIREMFELYASGQYSLRTPQAEINRRGLRNLNEQPLTLHGVETILNDTFYTGLITITRTGSTFDGAHVPLIPAKLFQRVQDIKSGRSGPKITRHNHLFQGLFRCGLCAGPMTPERQKGRCYYRCQKHGCPTVTVREDRLEEAIVYNLRKLQIEPALADRMKATWLAETPKNSTEDKVSALRLQLADEEKKLNRLTDLLVEGTIDGQTYQERQRSGRLLMAELKEQLAETPDRNIIEQNRRDYLELMKSLSLLYKMGIPSEKREIVENAFSNRAVAGKYVELEPYDWLKRHDAASCVLECDPQRYKDTDLTGVPVGCEKLQNLIDIARSRMAKIGNK